MKHNRKAPKKLFLLVIFDSLGNTQSRVYEAAGRARNEGDRRVRGRRGGHYAVYETVCDWQVPT